MNSNSKLIIVVAFSVVLSLQLALVAFAITNIQSNQKEVEKVNQNNLIAHTVFDLRDAAHIRALLIYQMAASSDPFIRDDLWMEFKTLAQKFIIAKDKMLEMEMDPKFKKMFTDTLLFSGKGAALQGETVSQINNESVPTEDIHLKLEEEVVPAQVVTMERLTNLLNSVNAEMDLHINALEEKNKNAIILIASLCSIGLLLGITISIVVTRRIVKSESAFIEQRELADKANEAKSMFLANMSHEIRSPLTAIIGFSESILNRNISDKKKEKLTKSILRNSSHLYQVINDILDITKIEAEQFDMECIETDLHELFTELSSIVTLQAEKKGLSFETKYQFPLPQRIKTDPTRLKQILVNLVNNAIKFTHKGSITIHVSFDADTQSLHCDVIDTGIGMSEEQASKIFTAFSQADSSTTRKFGGTGLGLSISKQLSEKLGGQLSCTSKLDQGSKFSFFVSTGDVSDVKMLTSDEELKIHAKTSLEKSNKFLKGNVLLAEDTKDNQELITMYIEDIGATIRIANNGEEAVKLFKNNKFDLVLMDMQMPVMDGVTATKHIRDSGSDVPIISLTANAMKSDVEKCYAAGATEFLTKPIDINRFEETLYRYLEIDENKKSRSEIEQTKKNRSQKMKRIADRFLDDLPERIMRINAANDSENWNDLENESHKLKGLGTTMGYPELTRLCEEINVNCKDKTLDNIPTLITKLNRYSCAIL